jgi:ferric-dicitrate binding protein FerR (iron transport regulator)
VICGYWYLQKDKIPGDLAFDNITVPADYKTAYNKSDVVTPVTLSDGSIIELQPRSALYFPVRFTGATRDVYLTGDAFFLVAHDTSKHFIVHTEEGLVTEVLGTSFYILHDRVTKKVEVSVVTGKVSVYEQKEKGDEKRRIENRIILTANQKVSYKQLNNQFITSLVEEPKPLEHRSGGETRQSFIFDDASLLTVLKVLETAYGITIQTEDQKLDSCHFTGDLTRQNLYDKLDIICKSLQASYEINGTTIYMRGKGCN